jgi:hypothetical protein
MNFSGATFMPSFVKIGHMFKNLRFGNPREILHVGPLQPAPTNVIEKSVQRGCVQLIFDTLDDLSFFLYRMYIITPIPQSGYFRIYILLLTDPFYGRHAFRME